MRINRRLFFGLSRHFEVSKRPFLLVGQEIGLSEKQVIDLLKEGKRKGFVRRFGAVLGHRRIGLKANALVAWKVEKERINKVGKFLAGYPEVSHCYLRSNYSFWPYNIYTMLHAPDKRSCLKLVKSISRKARVRDFRVLFTLKEFKKSRPDLREILEWTTNESFPG